MERKEYKLNREELEDIAGEFQIEGMKLSERYFSKRSFLKKFRKETERVLAMRYFSYAGKLYSLSENDFQRKICEKQLKNLSKNSEELDSFYLDAHTTIHRGMEYFKNIIEKMQNVQTRAT